MPQLCARRVLAATPTKASRINWRSCFDGDDEGLLFDIAIENILYDVKTVAATTEHYAPGHIEAYMKAEHVL